MSATIKPLHTGESVTLREAAEQLDVHYMTAYRYVRTGRMYAEKRGGQWWVAPADLAAVVSEGTGPRRAAREQGPSEPRQFLVEPFTSRLVVGDTAGCWDFISDALAAGAAPAEIHTRLIQPALNEVGERWSRGELTVAAEHRATATAQRLLGQLGPLFRHRGRRRGTIVLGSVAGDAHALPTALMADLLSDLRFDVIDLGANAPTESFVEVCADLDDLVGIGLCSVVNSLRDQGIAQAKQLREALPDTFLLVGGPAFTGVDTASGQLEGIVDAVSANADDARAAFERAVNA